MYTKQEADELHKKAVDGLGIIMGVKPNQAKLSAWVAIDMMHKAMLKYAVEKT